jgi:hypothetical protein
VKTTFLHINLLSETTPGKGRGSSVEVDNEVDHDEYGLPVISGRTIQGLLRGTWQAFAGAFPELEGPGRAVFGRPGANQDVCITWIGDAQLPEYVRMTVRKAIERKNKPLDRERILLSLTHKRHQTALDRGTGSSRTGSLRTSRVLLPGLILISPVIWHRDPSVEEVRCFAMAVLGTRRLGAGVTRGRGYVRIDIDGDPALAPRLAGLEVKPT